MAVTLAVKELLIKYKDLLKENKLEEFFAIAEDELGPEIVDLSNFFVEKNIDSLSYCKTKVPNWLFLATPIKRIIIPDNLVIIGVGAFQNCNALKEVQLSPYTTTIESSAFSECISLRRIRLPKTVTEIGRWNFTGCPNLKIECEFNPEDIDWEDWEKHSPKIVRV